MATSIARARCSGILTLWIWIHLTDSKEVQVTSNESSVSLDHPDILLPYTKGHGPAHSHRHVRDCQPSAHGSSTYESWPSSRRAGLPVARSSTFISKVQNSSGTPRWVYGHMTTVHDPLRTLSVLEPGWPGGCGMKHRALVEETAMAAGCLYALNAGFFDTKTNKCLGNVVSDGRKVRDSGGVQNAQFGIREDGSLVFGYLSHEDIVDRSNPFVQLVSGVVWLLRNGDIYINQSLEVECDKTATDVFNNFVNVLSARTAVGHDAKGNLVLFHVDGQSNLRGMSLWEVAEVLKKNGVVNAVNLDGGGSSTFVINGSVANYTPDPCTAGSSWRCARPVSTILCVHQRRCQPEDCSRRGHCVDGRCRCQEGWRGVACDTPTCLMSACGTHALCTAGGCVCAAGWRGDNCSQVCPPGFFGLSCALECQCDDGCPCDPVTGSCASYRSTLEADLCQAKQVLAAWRRHREEPYLAEQTWMLISLVLASPLLLRLGAHLLRIWRRFFHFWLSYRCVSLGDRERMLSLSTTDVQLENSHDEVLSRLC